MEWMLLPFKRYAQLGGRSQRKEYWMFYLFTVIVNIVINALFGGGFGGRSPSLLGGLLSGAFALFTFVPQICVGVRRLHDTDRSGWWLLLVLVPVLGWIALLVFMCTDGTPGPNSYGEDPKGRGLYGVFS